MNNAIKMTGTRIKADNGSGYSLSQQFPGRRFHGKTVYEVRWNGVQLDASTVTSIKRSRNGWGQ